MLKRESNQNWMKARVCHSLPGRLRLTATGLRFLPDNGRALAEALARYTEKDAIVNVHEDQQYFTVSVQQEELVTTRVVLLAEGRLAVAALTYPVEDMEIYAA